MPFEILNNDPKIEIKHPTLKQNWQNKKNHNILRNKIQSHSKI